jgi:hypothetical protein
MSHAFLFFIACQGQAGNKNEYMQPHQSLEFLQQPFSSLGFSAGFIQKAAAMELKTPEDIILSKETDIRQQPAYSDAWYDELIDFLDSKGVLYLLDGDYRTEK